MTPWCPNLRRHREAARCARWVNRFLVGKTAIGASRPFMRGPGAPGLENVAGTSVTAGLSASVRERGMLMNQLKIGYNLPIARKRKTSTRGISTSAGSSSVSSATSVLRRSRRRLEFRVAAAVVVTRPPRADAVVWLSNLAISRWLDAALRRLDSHLRLAL